MPQAEGPFSLTLALLLAIHRFVSSGDRILDGSFIRFGGSLLNAELNPQPGT